MHADERVEPGFSPHPAPFNLLGPSGERKRHAGYPFDRPAPTPGYQYAAMSPDPALAVDEVKDLPSLIEFIGVLGRDWDACVVKDKLKPSSPYESMYGWENLTVGMFLEAMQAWSLDAEFQDGGNPHQLFARMLMAGKGYE